jgi:hypothetical protein
MKPYESVTTVTFPNPTGINVNMMPFILGNNESLPAYLKDYAPLIDACDIEETEHGLVGYLTVMETPTTPGTSHRRGGVHVEKHPTAGWGGGGWGRGLYGPRRLAGLYIASNMADTTKVWETEIEEPGPLGNCEHLRGDLGESITLKAGELIWLKDSCPHESLPAKTPGTRQFFRVVTSQIALWYTEHSTPNPLGVTPPESVKLVTGSKFDN